MLWIGVGVLVGGAVLFGYALATVQSLFEKMREPHTWSFFQSYSWLSGAPSPFQILEEQLLLVQLLQLVGLVLVVLGVVMLAYGLWVKKENR